MALNFPSPDEVADEYLTNLKARKPEVDISLTDSDWWIRSRVVGGVMSGIYADQRLVANDAFPQSARHDALLAHLQLLFVAPNNAFKSAQISNGNIKFGGTSGSTLPALTQFTYAPNGNVYQTTSTVVLTSATGVAPAQSVSTGQNQNLLEGALLGLSSPPSGINATGVVFGGPFADGRDIETDQQAALRILLRYQNPPAGGTVADYRNYALNADPSVVDANVVRYIYGLGTVGVIVTAGTTDIDSAVTNGDPVVRIPSQLLLDKVQAALAAQVPLTDCPFAQAPVEVSIDVTAQIRYNAGNGSTVPPGQTLTQEQLVKREITRAIYKTPPGGRQIGGTGFVIASELEEVLDIGLANTPYVQGSFAQIVADRQIEDLSASGANRYILPTELAAPGNITIVSF